MTRSHHPQARPRVGFVTESFLQGDGSLLQGGAERHLFQLASMARDIGAEVTIYQRGSRAGHRTFSDMPVVTQPARLSALGRVLGERAVADGCTHVHYQYLERVPRRLRGARVTATSHAVYWDVPYVEAYRQWYPGKRAAAPLLTLWRMHQLVRNLLAVGRCDRVLATDTSLLRLLQSCRPDFRQRIDVVMNFTDLGAETSPAGDRAVADAALEPLRSARTEGRVVVLVPRNLSFVRGGAWLCDIVEQTVGTRDCHYFLTGSVIDVYGHGQRYERLFRQRIDAMGADSRQRLHLLGGLPREAMRSAFEMSDIVLIPTFAHEGTSLAALEGMGAGLPVVSTNVGGLNDVIRHGATGMLVSPDVTSLAGAVALLAGDEALRKRLGDAGRRAVEESFTLAHWRERAEAFATRVGWAATATGPGPS